MPPNLTVAACRYKIATVYLHIFDKKPAGKKYCRSVLSLVASASGGMFYLLTVIIDDFFILGNALKNKNPCTERGFSICGELIRCRG